MFVQIFRGLVRAEADAVEGLERWLDELRPGADGWLGMTAGVTDADELVAVVRFESEDAARRNSQRPEQGAWWDDMAARFTGPVTFHDCPDVALIREGGDDAAGFVQVIEAHGRALPGAAELAEVASRLVERHRPDVLGGLVAAAPLDGVLFQTVYFSSEAEARAGEREDVPADAQGEWAALEARMSGEPAYHDLRSPLLVS